MRRLPFMALLLIGACSPSAPPSVVIALTPVARELPARFLTCVRAKAPTTPAIYDVFYPCREELVWHVASLPGLTQEQKSELIDALDRKGMSYAHERVMAHHSAAEMRRAIGGPAPVAEAQASDSLLSPSEKDQMRRWADCSVQAIADADRSGLDDGAILTVARTACGHMWAGTPAAADRIYAKILTSVRSGTMGQGYTISPPQPMPPIDKRF